jgi:hypothetical protein
LIRIVALLLAWAGAARGSVQLEIHYPVIEKFLARMAFTADGRQYVKGRPGSRCTFAYLENPRISASGGRLVVRARFSGRSALDLLGACVGMGDSFDLVLRATPHYEAGELRLKDVEADTDVFKSLYVTRVLRGLAAGLPGQFRYPLRSAVAGTLEQPRDPAYSQTLSAFHVVAVNAANHALVLVLDLTLEVR